MKESEFENIVYSKNVIEFVTVANKFCTFIENIENISRIDFIETIQKILPLLYLKATLLPKIESTFEEANEKFVTEQDWNFIHDKTKAKLGKFDEYLEVFDARIEESETPVVSTISENVADIYQDTKDFLMLYRIGTTEFMNDSIWECYENFTRYWGQKLVNVLRAIHNVAYNEDLYTDEDEFDNNNLYKNELNTKDWIITKKQKDFREDYE